MEQVNGERRFWHVTMTFAGDTHEPDTVKTALVRFAEQHAFLHSLRYSCERAEVSYWEEADEMHDAAAMALRVWTEHRDSAGLPRWQVVGLEVLERDTFNRRAENHGMTGLGLRNPDPVPF